MIWLNVQVIEAFRVFVVVLLKVFFIPIVITKIAKHIAKYSIDNAVFDANLIYDRFTVKKIFDCCCCCCDTFQRDKELFRLQIFPFYVPFLLCCFWKEICSIKAVKRDIKMSIECTTPTQFLINICIVKFVI